jgi:hypothetical protein
MFNVEDFYKRDATYYPLNKADIDVKIFFTYKGMPVNPQFIDEYPEIYPSKDKIQKKYEELKDLTQPGKTSFFTVTEDGFKEVQLNALGGFPA